MDNISLQITGDMLFSIRMKLEAWSRRRHDQETT